MLGGTRKCKGLGFRFVQSKSDPFPIPVGRDGVLKAICPPYYSDMRAAVVAAIAGTTMKMDEWEARGMLKPHTAPNSEFDAATVQASPKGIEWVKDICSYIYDTYGNFPATQDPIQMTLFAQAHHLDLDFYDQHMKPVAYSNSHKHHFRDWYDWQEPKETN